jgi:penicillin-binding protein 2A
MPKGQFFHDTFEQLAEFGKSTAKQSAQAVKQTLSPNKILEQVINNKGIEQLEKGKSKGQNHTLLDFEKLQKKYENQDKAKADVLRNRLFQLVKQGEEKTAQEEKQKKREKEQIELQQEQKEKQKKEQEKKQQEQGAIPQGKQRKSIFSVKKIAQRQHTEVKPASGKQ